MADKTFLKTMIIVLLVINAGTLGYLWLGARHNGPGGGQPSGNVVTFLTRELDLTPEQQSKMQGLHESFRHDIHDVQEHLRMLHTPFFNLLPTDSAGSPAVSVVIDSLAGYHKKIEWLTYNQFRQIRAVCTPAQQRRFDDLVDETLRLMTQPPGKKPE